MMANDQEMKIALQVGSELRIKSDGEIIISNPELELAQDEAAADAVLGYRFDEGSKEHVLRLIDPVADHKHLFVHHEDD